MSRPAKPFILPLTSGHNAVIRAYDRQNRLPTERGSGSSPVAARSFFCNVCHTQKQHFQQAVIGRKDGFDLGNLAELAVKALNGVGGVDESAYLLGYLK